MSMTQIDNCRAIEGAWSRKQYINMTETEVAHFRRLLNYRQKGREAREVISNKILWDKGGII